MKKINCLVVDNVPSSLKLIGDYVKLTPFLELKGKCSTAFDAIQAIADEQIDLVFLNIHMPDLNNKDFSKIIKEGPRIILTTSIPESAFIGFRVNAVDCLIKPITYEKFLQASRKAQHLSLP